MEIYEHIRRQEIVLNLSLDEMIKVVEFYKSKKIGVLLDKPRKRLSFHGEKSP